MINPQITLNHKLVHSLAFFTLLSSLLFVTATELNAQQTYFQQNLDYKINVTLNDSSNVLTGYEELRYTNNSPDTLHYIYMHLWPNAYRDRTSDLSKQLVENGSTALYFADDKERGFIDSIDFKINDIRVQLEYEKPDIAKLLLKEPLLPGSTTVITTPFRVKIPNARYSRFGHTGDAFYVSQWYPKPAVYDRNGWNPIPYLNLGEYYSEFGKYEVSITLPQNYVVGATGELQDANEHEWLLKKSKEPRNFDKSLKTDSFPPSSGKFKTITYIQDSIHDFAWFADKRFNVLMGTVTLPKSGRQVQTTTLFTNKFAEPWLKTNEYVDAGMKFLADKVGEYPYNAFTVVDGTISAGGGMEYPMITIINSPDNLRVFESTVFHELCHNWFYGILANNERKNGWMDEGITSFYEMMFADAQNEGTAGIISGFLGKLVGLEDANAYDIHKLTYKLSSHNNSDQPVSTHSAEFTSLNYGAVLYSKSALALRYLHDYLGEEMFDKCMRNYFTAWQFKHPQPADIKASFEATSGKNLAWFFDELLNTNHPACFKPAKLGGDSLIIKNYSHFHYPVKIESDNGSSIWIDGFEKDTIIQFQVHDSRLIYFNQGYESLLKCSDKPYNARSMNRKFPDFQFRPFYRATDKPGAETIYYTPAVGWNNYNHWMAGIHVSNMDLIPEPFEFYAVPLYDFSNQNVAGLAGFEYNIWPLSGTLNEVKLSLTARRFAFNNNNTLDESFREIKPVFFYSKLAPGLSVSFRKKTPRSTISSKLAYRNISVWFDEISYTKVDSTYQKSYEVPYLNFNELVYSFQNSRAIDPFNLNLRAEQGNEHIKLSMEFHYRLSYKMKKKGIDLRLFAGGFLLNKTTNRNYNFRMAGWNGSQDYLYDETFFGRNESDGILSQQFLVRDGGFKIPTNVGQTGNWLAAVNIGIDLPVPLPIKLFADIGSYEGISTTFDDLNNKIMYDGGIAIVPVKDVFEIYFPLFKSKDITKSLDVNNVKFAEQIRFVFNWNKITPANLRNNTLKSFQ